MIEWVDYRSPPEACPFCGKANDLYGQPDGGGAPEAGAVTICIGCGGIAVLDGDLRQRKPTDAQLFQLMTSDDWPTIERYRLAVEMTRRGKPGPKKET